MSFELRLSAFWLGACSLGVGVAFALRQYPLLPDIILWDWVAQTVVLFVVAAAGLHLALKRGPARGGRAFSFVVRGHLVAMLSTYVFLESRIKCIGISFAPTYLLPEESGALILFAPSLAPIVLLLVRRYRLAR